MMQKSTLHQQKFHSDVVYSLRLRFVFPPCAFLDYHPTMQQVLAIKLTTVTPNMSVDNPRGATSVQF